ncbi:MAG: hypothetical protein AABX34_07380 [Nanoarchaeota archaeon]
MFGVRLRAFAMYIVLLVTFLSLINIVFNLHRFAFAAEFLILLALMLLGLIAAIGISTNMRWSWILMAWVLASVFADMVLIENISSVKAPYFFYIAGVAVAGFFISLFSIEKKKEDEAKTEVRRFVGKSEKKEAKEAEKKVEKSFKPGKYIASVTGAKFHSPKCDWAKKIKKSNAVWFDNKEDALKAGYKADDCVK